jgi:hypothetical protein
LERAAATLAQAPRIADSAGPSLPRLRCIGGMSRMPSSAARSLRRTNHHANNVTRTLAGGRLRRPVLSRENEQHGDAPALAEREGCDWGPNRQFRNGRRQRQAVNQPVELLTTLAFWAENARERGKRRLKAQGCAWTPTVQISNRERGKRGRSSRSGSRPAGCERNPDLGDGVNQRGSEAVEKNKFGSPTATLFRTRIWRTRTALHSP